MDEWVARLRARVAQIAAGDCLPDPPDFAQAPAGVAELSGDLDNLARMIAEREALRKALALEVHHRVKNNLQIVTSLVNMQANRLANPAAREALGQTRARIGALALIHRLIYERADDGSQASLDSARLLAELGAQIRLANRGRSEVTFSCEASAVAVPLDSALPLALFAVEAITNAYAYAFPAGRAGTVALRFAEDDAGQAVLSVRDDGIGFDSADNVGSMGRQLMQGFAEQLGGSYAILSASGSGTEVRLEYRLG